MTMKAEREPGTGKGMSQKPQPDSRERLAEALQAEKSLKTCEKPRSFIGRIFGSLTVLKLLPKRKLLVHCGACGKTVARDKGSIYRTVSCGCLRDLIAGQRTTIHGATRNGLKIPEYNAWKGMIDRVRPEHQRNREYYFERGIGICKHLRNSFPAFLELVGKRPSKVHSIDRIDNDKGYLCKVCLPPDGNLRWATASIQRLNQRRQAHKVNGGICRIPQCGENASSKGLCSMHYTRWRRHGSVDVRFSPYGRIKESGLKRCAKHPTAVYFDGADGKCPACQAEREFKNLTRGMLFSNR